MFWWHSVEFSDIEKSSMDLTRYWSALEKDMASNETRGYRAATPVGGRTDRFEKVNRFATIVS
jgi:hypothetical protein